MGFLPAAFAIASTVLTGVSEFGQAKYQQQVAKNNEQIALDNAEKAAYQSQQEQLRSDREYAAMIGEQTAAQGASGFDALGRSQMAVRDQTRRVRGTAAMDIRRQGEATTQGFQQEAANFAGEARAASARAFTAAAGTVLGVGGEFFPKKTKTKTSIAGNARSISSRYF